MILLARIFGVPHPYLVYRHILLLFWLNDVVDDPLDDDKVDVQQDDIVFVDFFDLF